MRVELKNLVKQYSFLTTRTLYRMVSERTIPHYKIGGKIIFDTNEIEEWISMKRVKTQDEIEASIANKVLTKK